MKRLVQMGVVGAVSILLLVPVPAHATSPSNNVSVSTVDGDSSARYARRTIINDCDRVVARPKHINWCGNTSDRLQHLRWTLWGKHNARARGIVRINNCKPSCAEGTMRGYRSKARLHKVVSVNGHPRFIRLTIRTLQGPHQGRTTIPLYRKPWTFRPGA